MFGVFFYVGEKLLNECRLGEVKKVFENFVLLCINSFIVYLILNYSRFKTEILELKLKKLDEITSYVRLIIAFSINETVETINEGGVKYK